MSDIKSELKMLIDEEKDQSILQAVKTILEKTLQKPVLKEKLSRRAKAAEKDIQNGRLKNREEVEKELDKTMGA